MKILKIILVVACSNVFAGVDQKILVKGKVTARYADSKLVSIKDKRNQEFLLPRKSLNFIDKKKRIFISEIDISEMKKINSFCLKNKKVHKSLCFK